MINLSMNGFTCNSLYDIRNVVSFITICNKASPVIKLKFIFLLCIYITARKTKLITSLLINT